MPDDEKIINSVRSYSSGVRGRSIAAVRGHHFVVDEPWINEAQTPAETFLAGVSACAVGLIEHVAHERGTPLSQAEATIEGFREKANSSYFQKVEMTFKLDGVDEETARDLVRAYQEF